jgi:hypothetical protein
MVAYKPINHNNPKTAKTHKKRRGKRRKSKRHKKSGPMPTISKKKKEDTGGPVDEKGNPFPIDNPQGGDPICPGGFKIDYDFDPLNDPINPPFRCISSLKDSNDGIQNLGVKNITNNNNDNDNDTSNELQTDDEDTIRGGRGGRGCGHRHDTKKYKHTSYSKTRRRYRKHQ